MRRYSFRHNLACNPAHIFYSLLPSAMRSSKSNIMAILDLDKIIFKKITIGINCKACGGNLKPMNRKTFTRSLITVLTFGRIKPDHYECENCKKRFVLL